MRVLLRDFPGREEPDDRKRQGAERDRHRHGPPPMLKSRCGSAMADDHTMARGKLENAERRAAQPP